MNRPLKAAVIGAGQMGHNHARVYSEIPAVKLVAVADTNQETAQWVARRLHVNAYQDTAEMLNKEQPDIVSVAVPTCFHHAVSIEAINNKCNLLIEKPITPSEQEAQDIIARAKAARVKLMVGHTERFNPAVQELHKRLSHNELGQLYYLETRRTGPRPLQTIGTGVTLDLAIHDLDVIQFITDCHIKHVSAAVRHFQQNTHEDWMHSTAFLNSNIVASVHCNWLTPMKIRELSVVGSRGLFHVNYLTQDLTYYETGVPPQQNWEMLELLHGQSEGRSTKLVLTKREPLRAEIESFISSVQEDKTPPVPGEAGLNVIRIAHAILRSAKEEKIIPIAKQKR